MVDDCPMSSIAASMFIYILSTERWKKLGTQLYSWSLVDLRMKSLFEDWHPSPPVTKFSKFLKPSTALKANNITHILSRYKLVSHLYQCQLWRWTVVKMEPSLFFWKQYCSISGETGHSKGGANWKEKVSHLGHLSHLLLKLAREYLQICMTKHKIRLRSLGRHQACSVFRLCFEYFFKHWSPLTYLVYFCITVELVSWISPVRIWRKGKFKCRLPIYPKLKKAAIEWLAQNLTKYGDFPIFLWRVG